MSDALCAGHPEPLWDSFIDGETEVDTTRRHTRALAICRACPVRPRCAGAIDVLLDDGIRGGILLPALRDAERTSWRSWQPGRGGIGSLVNAS